MFDGLLNAVLGFIQQYGFFAIFVYMVLETAFILHYVPSEVVIPFAAQQLVHGPFTFVLYVADASAGAALGSIVAYLLFGQYGRSILERYGHVIHVSRDRLDWSENVFVRYGESSVFWGRMLPFLRAFISIPAGLAEMEFRRFVVYSAAGSLLFNIGLTYLVYTGAGETSPLKLVVSHIRPVVARQVAYARTHPSIILVLVAIIVVVVATVWAARNWIRTHPEVAKQLVLHLVRIVGVVIGGLFVLGALSSPESVFATVTSFWNDPVFWVQLGFSKQVALLFVGLGIAFLGIFVYEIGQLIKLSHLQSVIDKAVAKIR